MTDRRGLAAGVCFVAGGVPLVVFYGVHPFGFLGVALVAFGAAVGYGAHLVE